MKLLLPAQRVYDAACATIKAIERDREKRADAIISEYQVGKWWRWTNIGSATGRFDGLVARWRLRWRVRTRDEAIEEASHSFEWRTVDMWGYAQYDDCENIRDGAAAMLRDLPTALVEMTGKDFSRISYRYLKP